MYWYHPFPVVADLRKREYENKSTALDRHRETNRHMSIEADIYLDINFSFAAVVLWLLRLLLQDPARWCRLAPTLILQKMATLIIDLPSHLRS